MELLNGTGTLVTQDMEKAELLNAFFTSALTSNTSLQQSQAMKTKSKSEARKIPLVEEDQVREYLLKLDVCKSMVSNGMNTQVLKELADVFMGLVLILFE